MTSQRVLTQLTRTSLHLVKVMRDIPYPSTEWDAYLVRIVRIGAAGSVITTLGRQA